MADIRRSFDGARGQKLGKRQRMRRIAFVGSLCGLLAGMLLSAAPAAAVSQQFTASLTGGQETPPNGSTATGTGTVLLNAAETQITVNLSFTGLSSNATAAHIHGPAPTGVPAGIPPGFGLTGVPAATSGSTTPNQVINVTPTQVAQLRTGQLYFNVHNEPYPNGEIRGQIVPGPSLPALVRTSTTWLLRNSLTTGPEETVFSYGAKPLVPLIGDWDGNGSRTPGTYEMRTFKLTNSIPPGPASTFVSGDARGFAVAGDFNGDAADDVATYRNGQWQVRYSSGGFATFIFGAGSWPATVPVAGDWNGDGVDGIGTYTYSTATWNLRNTASPGSSDAGAFVYGTPGGSYPVVGDWDLDNRDTVGVKQGATWSLRNTNAALPPQITFDYGLSNDLPLSWRPNITPSF